MTSQLVDIHTPGLAWWLKHLENDFDPAHSVELFIGAIKRRSICEPAEAAIGTTELFLRLIATYRFVGMQQLVDYVIQIETRLFAARPCEMAVRNMARRIMGIICEEAENNGMGEEFEDALARCLTPAKAEIPQPSLLLTSDASPGPGASTPPVTTPSSLMTPQRAPSATLASPQTGTQMASPHQPDIRPAIIQDIQELLEELESCEHNISELATQIISRNDTILTYGFCPLVKELLLRGSQKREFTLVIVEGSPNLYKGVHATVMNKEQPEESELEEALLKKTLQERGIQIIVIPDSDICNFMPRINKVLLGTNYILVDGSLVAPAGTMNIARAARELRKPVIIVAGSYSFCPVSTFQFQNLCEMGDPKTVGFEEGWLLDNASFTNPLVEHISNEYVGFFVTNNGTFTPFAMLREILNLYHMTKSNPHKF